MQQHLHLPLIFASHQITVHGMIITTSKKFIGIKKPEKAPNDLIGIIGLNRFAKKAAAVVLDVMDIALELLLKAYAILLLSSAFGSSFSLSWFITSGATCSLYFQASMNTNMSSAAIPITKKIPMI